MIIKIFCDSANYKIIKKYSNLKLGKGFTTNPSLMRISGAKNYKDYSLKILKICRKQAISFEVFSDEVNLMIKQAYKINSWGKNIYVKIPVVNSRGKFTGKAIQELSSSGVKLNITAVYTYHQVNKIVNLLDKNTNLLLRLILVQNPKSF